MKACLILTVDTEEEFCWGRFRRAGESVGNIERLWDLQRTVNQLGARTTYFVDYPVLKGNTSRRIVRDIRDRFDVEMGVHLHPWCTPPFEEELSAMNSMTNMIASDLVRRKMESVMDAFFSVFGSEPTSYRAGRYGFSSESAKIISDLGFQIDSSVTPLYDWSKDFGPDYSHAPFGPYKIDTEDILKEANDGTLLEVPISCGFNRVPLVYWRKVYCFLSKDRIRNYKLIGLLNRTGVLKRIMLAPELHSVSEMKALVSSHISESINVLNMIFHSSSLIPGGNLIVKTLEDVNQFKSRLTGMIKWIIDEKNARPILISELSKHLEGSPGIDI